MAVMTAAERAKEDPAKAAMYVELGSSRFDEFPMEDGEVVKKGQNSRVYSYPPRLSRDGPAVLPAKPPDERWLKAKQQGEFDDDDAAQYSQMDSMEDGQLARNRRHARDTPTSHVNENYNGSSSNAYPQPRAAGPNGGRQNMSGRVPHGNEPIDIPATMSGGTRPARPGPGPGPGPVSRGEYPGGGSSSRLASHSRTARPFVQAAPHLAVSQPVQYTVRTSAPPFPSQPATASAVVQPTFAVPQTQNSQTSSSASQTHLRVVLPNGASIALQLPAMLGGGEFPEKTKYSGQVYLVFGSQPSEDMIILSVDGKHVGEIRRHLSEYDTYMCAENRGIILKFASCNGRFQFYTVEFEQAAHLKSFNETLRKLVERPNQSPSAPAITSANAASPTANVEGTEPVTADVEEKIVVPAQKQEERKDAISRRFAELTAKKQQAAMPTLSETVTHKTVETTTSMSSLGSPADENRTVNTTSNIVDAPCELKESPTTTALSPASKPADDPIAPVAPETPGAATLVKECPVEVLEEICDWVWDIAQYMRNSAPESFGFDTMRAIISATSAAIMARKSPSFKLISSDKQRVFVEKRVRPGVERSFLLKLASNRELVDELTDTEASQQNFSQHVAPQPQASQPEEPQRGDREVTQAQTSQPESIQPQAIQQDLSRQLPKAQEHAEAQAAAPPKPSKLTGPVYEIKTMEAMRDASGPVVRPWLPQPPTKPSTARVLGQPSVRQPEPELPQVAVEEQVRRAAGPNKDWLYAGRSLHKHGALNEPSETRKQSFANSNTPDTFGADHDPNKAKNTSTSDYGKSDVQGEIVANFFVPEQKPSSPPAGLQNSIHNRGNASHPRESTGQFTGVYAPKKSTYQKDLEALDEQKGDNETVSDHNVTETTNAISRLSLN